MTSRLPIPCRLLRGPGETLRRRLQQREANLLLAALFGGLAPLVIMEGLATALPRYGPRLPAGDAHSIITAAGLFGLFAYIGLIWRSVIRLRRDRLGYFGVRVVGEHLDQLRAAHRIYHDIPARKGDSRFQLSHVVLGQRGIALIETEVRRKRRWSRPDINVRYDGKTLHWPWGADREGVVRQATANAFWLEGYILQSTGLRVTVRPIVAIPGWSTQGEDDYPIKVVNEKRIGRYVDLPNQVLSEEEVGRIAAVLDKLCRDVED